MKQPHFLPEDLLEPEVMFLPLAVAAGGEWQGVDPGIYSRRIPDFVHQVLNEGRPGPTAMLELQSASDEGPVTWVHMDEVPDHEQAFELLPPGLDVRAVVAGEIAAVDGGVRVEFAVFRDDGDEDEPVTAKVGGLITINDPVAGLLRLTRHLAKLLDLRYHQPPTGLLTSNGAAFRHFLQGLDNAMLLSGDLEIAMPEDREGMIRPFAEALALDPGFGLALRVANATAAVALDGATLDQEAVRRFLDHCYRSQPVDGEACVAIAEQLTEMGDDQRALAWLEHATHLDPPPARGLESLGILMVRRGDLAAAKQLWQRGLELDGHPDFFSHLAQLSFAEQREDEAWDYERQGLRRLRERKQRSREWDDGFREGVLLECLQAVLTARPAPQDLVASLQPLCGLLFGEERAYLGLCLLACGDQKTARTELLGSMRLPLLDLEVRDRVVRALLQISAVDFESRFAAAVERVQRGRKLTDCLRQFGDWVRLQPEFWPALYYASIAQRKLGQSDAALDTLALALDASPGQPEVLSSMAELFAARLNPKRALELIDEAIDERSQEPRFHAARVRYLLALGRTNEARMHLETLPHSGIDSRELRKLRRKL